ncbi:MAG: PIG-L family deacetylase [Terracidiphilus sp.]
MMFRGWILGWVVLGLTAHASAQSAAPLLPPDARFKADLLLVVAHPDDDVVVGGYLARLALDEHKRVAVVYCTRGDGGGNSVGWAAGLALGQEREQEARRALGSLGIENVWFLDGADTPGQDPLRSLDRWGHGKALEGLVRLVRVTRPDVVLTWLPDSVVGENHGDHQAAGVLAVEAFDLAGDATAFAEQVSPPRDRTGMANLTEGLEPWQPAKLYFFSDAFEDFGPYWHDPAEASPFRPNLMEGHGPSYPTTAVSGARRESYARLTARMQTFYATQEGDLGETALKSGDLKPWEYPVRLILGKSLVGGTVEGDVFEGIGKAPEGSARVRGQRSEPSAGLRLEVGDPWRYYARFWRAHNLEHLAGLIPVPEMAASYGARLTVPLEACNSSREPAVVQVAAELPAGWTDKTPPLGYPLEPGSCYSVQAQVAPPAAGKPAWVELRFKATAGTRPAGAVAVRVWVTPDGTMPQ